MITRSIIPYFYELKILINKHALIKRNFILSIIEKCVFDSKEQKQKISELEMRLKMIAQKLYKLYG